MIQRRRLNTQRSIRLTVAGLTSGPHHSISLVGIGWSFAAVSFEGELLRYIGISRIERHIVTTNEGRIREIDEPREINQPTQYHS